MSTSARSNALYNLVSSISVQMVPETLHSGSLDQLKDLSGLEDWGTFFLILGLLEEGVVNNEGGGGGPGGGGGAIGGAGGGGMGILLFIPKFKKISIKIKNFVKLKIVKDIREIEMYSFTHGKFGR